MQSSALPAAADILRGGGCIIYPTETYFALGALATDAAALARIVAIKARPAAKPLPILVGAMTQLVAVLPDGFLAGPFGEDFADLTARFWPGPLSLVVSCRASLPGLVTDGQARVSVRFTPHETAAALCRLAGGALVATSANVSGGAPTAVAADLDPAVAGAADALVTEGTHPAGGPASTVAGLLGGRRLRIYRQGAVAAATLEAAGYQLAGG